MNRRGEKCIDQASLVKGERVRSVETIRFSTTDGEWLRKSRGRSTFDTISSHVMGNTDVGSGFVHSGNERVRPPHLLFLLGSLLNVIDSFRYTFLLLPGT